MDLYRNKYKTLQIIQTKINNSYIKMMNLHIIFSHIKKLVDPFSNQIRKYNLNLIYGVGYSRSFNQNRITLKIIMVHFVKYFLLYCDFI
jgi:hypothetical protein